MFFSLYTFIMMSKNVYCFDGVSGNIKNFYMINWEKYDNSEDIEEVRVAVTNQANRQLESIIDTHSFVAIYR